MKLTKYFRQLKRFVVLPKEFIKTGIKNPYYYSYLRKVFIKFLFCGLFKDEIQIKFGSDYWKHVPKYISKLLVYFEELIDYKASIFYYNIIKKRSVLLLKPSTPLSPSDKAMHIYVNEFILEDVANKCGFKIVDEKLYPLKSIYTLSLQ